MIWRAKSISFIIALVYLFTICANSVAHEGDSIPVSSSSPSVGLVYGKSSSVGYKVYAAKTVGNAGLSYNLATLAPGHSDQGWVGYQCITGSGRFIAAVVAPRAAVNDPARVTAAGTGYIIRVSDGRVNLVATGVALRYHTPGCSASENVTFSSTPSEEMARTSTKIRVVDAAKPERHRDYSVEGHAIGAIMHGDSVKAIQGNSIVAIKRSHISGKSVSRVIARADRDSYSGAYDLKSDGKNLFFAQMTKRDQVNIYKLQRGEKKPIIVSKGRSSTTKLVASRRHVNLVTPKISRPRSGSQLHWIRRRDVEGLTPIAVTKNGSYFAEERVDARHSARSGLIEFGPNGRRRITQSHKSTARSSVKKYPSSSLPLNEPKASKRAINFTTPKCAVPRNELRRQVPQPNAKQVDWAIQQAVRGLLKGTVLSRPNDFLNSQLSGYQPSLDFPIKSLSGDPGSNGIPPSVVQAIYAQESNWKQASWHALPGVSGNPLIGDYYGSDGATDKIDYTNADCGYGVSQITDPMSSASTQVSANGKVKIALDYAENIQAGIQILADKWNQLYGMGVKVNNSDPKYIENWYAAIWAYNSGAYANTGSGPWGLGWTNNPRNADYPPDRKFFLRSTYADASHPADWPYQERVLGFAETPLVDYKGVTSYAPPAGSTASGGSSKQISIPGINAFCDSSNECDPNYAGTSASLSYCKRTDRKCWWNKPVTFEDCGAGKCHSSQYTVGSTATEPAGDDNYPPACSSTLSDTAQIVDNQSANLNIEGCNSTNWTNKGTFTVVHGQDATMAPIGLIDWHQVGTGFGGHTYFTHNRSSSNTSKKEVGRWTPASLTSGNYNVKVHVPSSGATSEAATYRIVNGLGQTYSKTINQHLHKNTWINLGEYPLGPGAYVELSNVTSETDGTRTVAYDAVALTKIASTSPTAPSAMPASFKPVLLFDTAEKWRPLNIQQFSQEKNTDGKPLHLVCMRTDSADADHVLGSSHKFGVADTSDQLEEIVGSVKPKAHCKGIASESDISSYVSGDAFLNVNGAKQALNGTFVSSDERTYVTPYTACVQGSLLDCNGNETNAASRSSMYYSMGSESGYPFVQYWMFYRYNSFSDGSNVAAHEGDWEAVSISPSSAGTAIAFAGFSAHGKWYHYLRSNLQCEDTADKKCGTDAAPGGKRLRVYVANGSHANYPNSCSETIVGSCSQSGSALPERGHDGMKLWGLNGANVGLIQFPLINSANWTDWSGHWGATGTPLGSGGPRSPGAQSSLYDKPWGACADNNAGCILPRSSNSGEFVPSKGVIASPVNSAKQCDNWFGSGVVALLCSNAGLKHSISTRSLETSPTFTMRIIRSKATSRASAEGESVGRSKPLVQAVGRPLANGDVIKVIGDSKKLRGQVLKASLFLRSIVNKRQVDKIVQLRFSKRKHTYLLRLDSEGQLADIKL